jgi:hypothetical protein
MKLGFHEPLSRLYVFVKNEANHLWYWLDDGRKNYIPHTALTGTIRSLEVKESQTSHGDRMKLDVEVVADRRYILRSGVESAFSRGMLMLIGALSDDQLKRDITLELKAGDEKGNVLVSGRDPETFDPIITGSWEGANWELLMRRAIARLGGSHPQPQPQPQPQTQPQPEPTITQRQYQDLLAMSKRNGYTPSGFGELLAKYGFSRGGDITQKAYPQLWAEACDRSIAEKMNARAESEMVRH